MTCVLRELPKYKCHKTVHALKILDMTGTPRGTLIIPAEKDYPPFEANDKWVLKHAPVAGGYIVWYEDGYCSFSPAAAFEKGYSEVVPRTEKYPHDQIPVYRSALDEAIKTLKLFSLYSAPLENAIFHFDGVPVRLLPSDGRLDAQSKALGQSDDDVL